jgi:dTDP-4-amino-4,6-dideoxygalactose transaminase
MAALKRSEPDLATSEPIAFVDLKAQQRRIRGEIDRAVARVLDHGQYIMGPEIAELERALATFCGAKHAITCSSGTDALLMIMMAQGIGPGDAVICPAFTYTATPEAIALLGATPVFCDVRADTFNIDVASLPGAIDAAKTAGLTPRALMAVDLFGLPADYNTLLPFAKDNGLFVISDAAQGFGAVYHGRKVGTFGLATATSFFPAKPLGCYGDGGAILTDDDTHAELLRSIRLHGKGGDKYDIVRVGINGRLDTLQAGILLAKLAIFPDEIEARQRVAARYNQGLHNVVTTPHVPASLTSVWAQYTITLPVGKRDPLMKFLAARGIPTAVYYPRGLHEQSAYTHYPIGTAGVAKSERLPQEVLSLPMHPYLDDNSIDRITAAIRDGLQVNG